MLCELLSDVLNAPVQTYKGVKTENLETYIYIYMYIFSVPSYFLTPS
jgi:hypothetical protein